MDSRSNIAAGWVAADTFSWCRVCCVHHRKQQHCVLNWRSIMGCALHLLAVVTLDVARQLGC